MAEVERQEKSFFIELGLKDSDGAEKAKSAAHCSSYYVGLPSNCSFSRTVLLEKGKEYHFFANCSEAGSQVQDFAVHCTNVAEAAKIGLNDLNKDPPVKEDAVPPP
jgi:hypothetical protein